MTEHKIDPNKYKGMSLEEARRAMVEDEREALANDPRTIAAARSAERYERERQGEQQRQADEARRQEQAQAAAEWEKEKQRRLLIWIASGGTEAEFDRAWPQLKERLLSERVDAFEREREETAFRA